MGKFDVYVLLCNCILLCAAIAAVVLLAILCRKSSAHLRALHALIESQLGTIDQTIQTENAQNMQVLRDSSQQTQELLQQTIESVNALRTRLESTQIAEWLNAINGTNEALNALNIQALQQISESVSKLQSSLEESIKF